MYKYMTKEKVWDTCSTGTSRYQITERLSYFELSSKCVTSFLSSHARQLEIDLFIFIGCCAVHILIPEAQPKRIVFLLSNESP